MFNSVVFVIKVYEILPEAFGCALAGPTAVKGFKLVDGITDVVLGARVVCSLGTKLDVWGSACGPLWLLSTAELVLGVAATVSQVWQLTQFFSVYFF